MLTAQYALLAADERRLAVADGARRHLEQSRVIEEAYRSARASGEDP